MNIFRTRLRTFAGTVASAALVSWCLVFGSSANAETKVSLELVLAIDTSTSVDQREYELQRSGLALAFRHPRVISAIEGLGAAGMAVSVVQWSGRNDQTTAVPWQQVNSSASAYTVADQLQNMPRLVSGFTDIANAITYSLRSIETNQFDGGRLAIDVSGDGTSERNDPAAARDEAISRGVTINGLIIQSEDYDLGVLARDSLRNHYARRVIGGPGAFLLEARSFDDFAVSMREKLYREISGPLIAQN